MSIRTRVTPNRAPDSQRADAPLVLAFGRGWRGEEGLETPPGLAESRRSLRSYVFGRRQRGPIVIREEGVGSGPRPGPGPQLPPADPCLRAALLGVPGDWRWPFGSALCISFICLFIYFGMVGEARSPPLWPRSGNSVLPRVPWTSGASVVAPREEQYIAFESGGGPRSAGETPRWWGVGDFCKP